MITRSGRQVERRSSGRRGQIRVEAQRQLRAVFAGIEHEDALASDVRCHLGVMPR
jgi:hypothetical protein